MTATVVSIQGDEVRSERGTNKDALASLASVMKMAKSGEVVGVAIAIQFADGSSGTNIGGFLRHYPVVGALEDMKRKLLADE